ncbi:hypothetical protein HBH64_103090 [Parastagonospora nodorum]|nr:hypothetical protein HBI10_122080 [Parastagonospora nodorum]KAH4024928.1 hypothetical protein HBI13_075120 [Parastagonospora nodorum]KAH4122500.1 hypothetical protein HBH47_084780 [Parastagonospora nodorum]KAH4170703.1 hypothetical protein HBH43_102060 [Parastagonospora nodorum]KAH4188221.1 hypothetical protein HBI95_230290 [Parastagonospora nodorum]
MSFRIASVPPRPKSSSCYNYIHMRKVPNSIICTHTHTARSTPNKSKREKEKNRRMTIPAPKTQVDLVVQR